MRRSRRSAPRSHSAVGTAQTSGAAPGLYTAAFRGDVEYLHRLLDAGAATDARTDGWTPLHAACANGHAEVASALLAAGADAALRSNDDDKLSPAEVADANGHVRCSQLVTREAKQQALRRAAATSPQRKERLERQRKYANRLSSPVRPRLQSPATQAEQQDGGRRQSPPKRQSSRPRLRPRGSRSASARAARPVQQAVAAPATSKSSEVPPPPGWQRAVSKRTGQVRWINAATGECRTEPPPPTDTAPSTLRAAPGELVTAPTRPVQQHSKAEAPLPASNRAAELRAMKTHGGEMMDRPVESQSQSPEELGSFGVAPRFGVGSIYRDSVASPPPSPGRASSQSRSRSRSVSPPQRRPSSSQPGNANGARDDSRGADSSTLITWLRRELESERSARETLNSELSTTQVAMRKSQQEGVSWQERALAAEQAVLELQAFTEERSQLGPEAAQPADAELAELHELISSQAATIEKLARIAQLPLDEDEGAAAAETAAALPAAAWPEEGGYDPPDDAME